MKRLLSSPAFWLGVSHGFALPAIATMAFLSVFRRAFKGDFPAVIYDAKSLWYTHDEHMERGHRVFEMIEAEFEAETAVKN